MLAQALRFGIVDMHKMEDLHGDYGNGQTGRLELAGGAITGNLGEAAAGVERVAGLALSKDGADAVAAAAAGAALVGDGDKDVGRQEGKVDAHGDKGREGAAGEAAKQQQAEQGVSDGDADDALDGADVGGRGEVVVGEGGEKVRVDAEDDDGAEELDGADEPLERLEAEGGASWHGGRLWCFLSGIRFLWLWGVDVNVRQTGWGDTGLKDADDIMKKKNEMKEC